MQQAACLTFAAIASGWPCPPFGPSIKRRLMRPLIAAFGASRECRDKASGGSTSRA